MKLQKIMLDGGFTCPNRDGSKGRGGCTFCLKDAFCPSYCKGGISDQVSKGKRFFSGKYPDMRFLAYFQAYSSTYAPVSLLEERYREALEDEDVVGLVIGTRPDCLPDDVLDLLCRLKEEGVIVKVELGVESLYDRTLELVNRCHKASESIEGIRRLHQRGIPVSAHMILGLPYESREDILREAQWLSCLPLESVKLHQLQILKETPMAQLYRQHPEAFMSMTLEEYVSLVAEFILEIGDGIIVERSASGSPLDMVIHPRWGVKPSVVKAMVERRLQQMKALQKQQIL